MSVKSIQKDAESLTMTVMSEFEAPIQRVWRLWEDPRQLERWWGPPTYPAKVVDHDLTPGGAVTYYMTGPEGDEHWGWWKVTDVDPPTDLEFEDGFGDESGNPNPELPVVTIRVRLAEQPGGRTSMSISTIFPSLQAMDQLVEMGMEEGIALAIGQIDDLLMADATAGPANPGS